MPRDVIELTVPSGRGWHPVTRLVLGGIADRLNLGFEELDDLQLAVETLLLEAGDESQRAHVRIEILEAGVRVGVGPLRERAVAEALQREDDRPGELTLRRILETVVDSFGVEEAADGAIVVHIHKAVRGA